MIKVAISDAHAVLREGIRAMLEHAGDFDVVGEAFDGASTLSLVRSVEAHVLTLGLSMLGIHGVELIAQIKKEKPPLRVLVLTSYPEVSLATLAFKGGASGFIVKTDTNQEIIEAIKKLRRGGFHVSLALAEQFSLAMLKPNLTLPHQSLSEREFAVFYQMASGETITQIARNLSLSVKTVSTYKARVFAKINLPHEAALVRYAMLHKLLENDRMADMPIVTLPAGNQLRNAVSSNYRKNSVI